MFIAYDSEGNRVYAEDADRNIQCVCPECGERLRFRSGPDKKAHFAHLQNSECHYGEDKNYMSPWHLRMQGYFPRDNREVRFEEPGERHIADVYLPGPNMVLEFQHSPINEEEFLSRTRFHISRGRRIVWLFDETPGKQKNGDLGRFRPDDLTIIYGAFSELYNLKTYKWLYNHRHFLSRIPADIWQTNALSICVFTGAEGDMFHRIIAQDMDFEYVVFSINDIVMSGRMDPEVFFKSEDYWMTQEPWKEKCDLLKALHDERLAQVERARKIEEARIRKKMDDFLFRGIKPKRRF